MASESKSPIITVRPEFDLFERIYESAKNGERSLNKEVIHVLKKHYGLKDSEEETK